VGIFIFQLYSFYIVDKASNVLLINTRDYSNSLSIISTRNLISIKRFRSIENCMFLFRTEFQLVNLGYPM